MGGSSLLGQPSASGTWSLAGTLLTMTLACAEAGAAAPCSPTRSPRVDVTVDGDTLGWHYGDHTTVWSFVRKH